MNNRIQLGRFDAILNTNICAMNINAELTLELRLGFRQINPADPVAGGTYPDAGSTSTLRKIIAWDAASWAAWKQNFCLSAERFWDGRFWLLNGRGLYAFKAGEITYIPNFACRFKLVGNEAGLGSPHHTIDVVRLDPSESFFRSHATLYDDRDIQAVPKGQDSTGAPIMQEAHVHEIGHLLGLGHVAIGQPYCPATGDTGLPQCYGVTDYDKNSVMGAGMQLRDSHAQPWQLALDRFMQVVPIFGRVYNPTPNFVKPNRPYQLNLYPRTITEYEADRVINMFNLPLR